MQSRLSAIAFVWKAENKWNSVNYLIDPQTSVMEVYFYEDKLRNIVDETNDLGF